LEAALIELKVCGGEDAVLFHHKPLRLWQNGALSKFDK
jgi:hypothetical protein